MQICIMIQVVKSTAGRLTASVMFAKKEFAMATLMSTGGSGLISEEALRLAEASRGSARDGRYCRAASYHCAATTLASLAFYFSNIHAALQSAGITVALHNTYRSSLPGMAGTSARPDKHCADHNQ